MNNVIRNVRFERTAVAKSSSRDFIENKGKSRRLLFNRNRMLYNHRCKKVIRNEQSWTHVCMLVAKLLNCRRQVSEENYTPNVSKFCARQEKTTLTHVIFPNFLCNLDVGTVCQKFEHELQDMILMHNIPTVPTRRPPLRQNFMLEVPDASVPAVEICWLISDAGIRISAKLTE